MDWLDLLAEPLRKPNVFYWLLINSELSLVLSPEVFKISRKSVSVPEVQRPWCDKTYWEEKANWWWPDTGDLSKTSPMWSLAGLLLSVQQYESVLLSQIMHKGPQLDNPPHTYQVNGKVRIYKQISLSLFSFQTCDFFSLEKNAHLVSRVSIWVHSFFQMWIFKISFYWTFYYEQHFNESLNLD